MKGRKQGECSGCGRGKGSHDRNSGWYEMGPRRANGYHLEHLFCPTCAAALLVGLDERLGDGVEPLVVAVSVSTLERWARLLSGAHMNYDSEEGAREVLRTIRAMIKAAESPSPAPGPRPTPPPPPPPQR